MKKNFYKDTFLPFIGVMIFIGIWFGVAGVLQEKFMTWILLPIGLYIFIIGPVINFFFLDRPIKKIGTEWEMVKLLSQEHLDYIKKELWRLSRPFFTFIGIITVVYFIYIIFFINIPL